MCEDQRRCSQLQCTPYDLAWRKDDLVAGSVTKRLIAYQSVARVEEKNPQFFGLLEGQPRPKVSAQLFGAADQDPIFNGLARHVHQHRAHQHKFIRRIVAGDLADTPTWRVQEFCKRRPMRKQTICYRLSILRIGKQIDQECAIDFRQRCCAAPKTIDPKIGYAQRLVVS